MQPDQQKPAPNPAATPPSPAPVTPATPMPQPTQVSHSRIPEQFKQKEFVIGANVAPLAALFLFSPFGFSANSILVKIIATLIIVLVLFVFITDGLVLYSFTLKIPKFPQPVKYDWEVIVLSATGILIALAEIIFIAANFL